MKLYLKQKFFSWKDQSTVKDELGNDKYYIEGKVFSVGKKLRVYDPNGTELAFVRQRWRPSCRGLSWRSAAKRRR